MNKMISKMMLFLAVVFFAAAPAFAHCGKCGMEGDTAKEHHKDGKQCAADCDKPCCADKIKKQCDIADCTKPCCADKKAKNKNAKMNFGPRSRK